MVVALNAGKSASWRDIASIEAIIGCPLSQAVRDFLDRYDGARPAPNSFRVSGSTSSGVALFIPASEIAALRSRVNGLPREKGIYPIAQDTCGNFVLIDEMRGGEVQFWDHERDDPPVRLAAALGEFLDALRPAEEVVLKPGQVESAWIDPDFLKEIDSEI